jgi:hypothetical protein
MEHTANLLSNDEQRFLEDAAAYLERPSFLIRTANLIGKPTEAILGALPQRAQELIAKATADALAHALEWAVRSLPAPTSEAAAQAGGADERSSRASGRLHTAVAATTGALGGFFGLAGMAVEVPATTTVMLRSIAQIAAENGADLNDPATRLQCLAVFSFGSPSLETMESAYFTGRLGLAIAIQDAAAFVARHTAREISDAVTRGSAPVLVRLINQIAARFQIVLSQKAAAQAVPIAGAATGALINAAFTDHFNTVARYHFGIVRLERIHGKDVVQQAYQQLRRAKVAQDGANR